MKNAIRDVFKKRGVGGKPPKQLREFVYMDETSVYSLVASWMGEVPSQRVDKNSESNVERGELGASAAPAGVPLKAGFSRQRTRATESQLVREANAQSTFKILAEELRGEFALRTPTGQVPEVAFAGALDDAAFYLSPDGWVVDPERLTRGDLLEIEVVLDAEPAFRAASVMSEMLDLIQSSPGMLGPSGGLSEASEMTRMISSLLGTVVPIRGEARSYRVVGAGGRTRIVHTSVVDQWPEDERAKTDPLYVVGSADLAYFWKDLRRVLFTQTAYTVMCRVGKSGLQTTWSPVKLLESLRGIDPGSARAFDAFNESLRVALDGESNAAEEEIKNVEQWVVEYALIAAATQGKDLDRRSVESGLLLAGEMPRGSGPSGNVETMRAEFDSIDAWLNAQYAVSLQPDAAVAVREIVMMRYGGIFGDRSVPEPIKEIVHKGDPQLLEVEIVAMYW